MADIMGSSGLAWHQWKKHGRCSGLTATEYFELSREAYEAVNRPQIFRNMTKDLRMPASVIEEAFLTDNPGLSPDMVTITCKDDRIQEARICLTRDMEPRRCGRDAVRDCTLSNAIMDAIP
jgi:ribonuclease T2